MTRFLQWAPTPPMGWNSWDCFGTTVTEQQTKANADYMAQHLSKHGWQYIVVDIQWYEPDAKGWEYRPDAKLNMDEYGRLIPALNRFPSAASGKGFKPLADYVHGKGLKFGVHILRGIPRQAVAANTPILASTARAADIADKSSTCPWNPDMYGIDVTRPGGQEYYNSIFSQFADWGVDFVKIDDLSNPYHEPEIEAIRRAIDKSGRP
ncbi:MAG: Melibiase subfamily, partial [Tepidisphaeraceae bacterium]